MSKTKTLTKIIYALIVSIIVLILILTLPGIFRIRSIETNAKPSDMEGFPLLGDQYLFTVSESKVKQFLLKNPTIKNVVIKKQYPGTLKIEVVYRQEVAQINTNKGIYIVDGDGFVFEKVSTPSALPVLKLDNKEVDLNTNITQKNIKTALKILEISEDKNLLFTDIIPLNDETISLIMRQTTQVIIGTNAKPEDIVSSLQMIVRRFTIEGKTIGKIDFRFDKPVVTF